LLYLGENHRDRGVFQVKTAEKNRKKAENELDFFLCDDILKDVLRLVSVFRPAGFIKKTSKIFRFWLDKFEIDDILNDVLHFVPQLRCRKADD